MMLLQTGPASLTNCAPEHLLQSSSSSSSTISSNTNATAAIAHSSPLALHHPPAPSSITSSSSASSTPPIKSQNGYVETIQEQLKEGWTVHTAKDGRLYYCNHITRTACWLPPVENWGPSIELPFGWEKAVSGVLEPGQSYYINHVNKTTTYERPHRYGHNEPPPEPRVVVLQRSSTLGFGFVAGSEKPVIVRFVTEGGPSVGKLEPGDQILEVNGEDVKDAPRDHVIQLVRNCDNHVEVLVCQPKSCYTGTGRKSTLLSPAKKHKLKTRPIRVRFAESVCVNGAPLFPPSAFSLGDILIPPMANVLKVFLENGQTKSFKYDSTTTVHDVVKSLRDKLCITAGEHFNLVLEHVKSLKRNKLTLLDPLETVARIASRPGAHKLRCLFRVTFVPVTSADLAQKDLHALDYLFMQCCNDVIQERFAPELQPDVALRLAALHMHQHALANNISPSKLTVKTVEREFGLERFVPTSLIDGMKRKELRRLISHFLKLNSQMTGSSTKVLTQLQAKIHYLDIISGLPSYGAKCFSTNQRDGVERVLLVSPRFGLSQIAGSKNSVPQSICTIEELSRVVVNRENDISNSVSVFISPDKLITFSMEDRDAQEFAIVLAGYYRLIAGKELEMHIEQEKESNQDDVAPPYLSQHSVASAGWNYIPDDKPFHSMAFLMPPPYHSTKQLLITSTKQPNNNNNNNINNNNNNNDEHVMNKNYLPSIMKYQQQTSSESDEFGFDVHSVVSMEILENHDQYKQTLKHYPKQKLTTFVEAKNQEVLRRVAEMQKMVENSQRYLNENDDEDSQNPQLKKPQNLWRETSVDIESDCESLTSSKQSSNEDAPSLLPAAAAPPPGILKHSDSLTLLTETIKQDLNGISNNINSMYTPYDRRSNGSSTNGTSTAPSSVTNTPKVQRRVNGLSQIISDLQALGNDLSQSESDSESLYTPNSSPIHRNPQNNINGNDHAASGIGKSMKHIRTSFGLHSPDALGCDTKDNNLKEYLRQLKEASSKDSNSEQDLAAKKLAELYGFELGDDSLIETDPDLIDLTTIPPPQTPDELDIPSSVLNAPPTGFDDVDGGAAGRARGDLEEFLKKVTIEPPTTIVTPAIELTPEEILSFIIPPPPTASSAASSVSSSVVNCKVTPLNVIKPMPPVKPKVGGPLPKPREINNCNSYYDNHHGLMNNSEHFPSDSPAAVESPSYVKSKVSMFNNNSPLHSPHIIEYPSMDRKGSFSCCSKVPAIPTNGIYQTNGNYSSSDEQESLKLPPKRGQYNNNNYYNPQAPERPPKSADLKLRLNSPIRTMPSYNYGNYSLYNNMENLYGTNGPPSLPPRINERSPPPATDTLRKPPLPPIPAKPMFYSPMVSPSPRSPVPVLKNGSQNSSPIRSMGSPHVHRHFNTMTHGERTMFNFNQPMIVGQFTQPMIVGNGFNNPAASPPGMVMRQQPQQQQNGHFRSHSDSYNTPNGENKTPMQMMCSPQLTRKHCQHLQVPGSPQLSNKNGHVMNVATLMSKTSMAMSGLLVKLDQVAVMCTNAQQAGGGSDIDDIKFQKAKEELTEVSLSLVTGSKLLVIAMSDAAAKNLPEHLTACLTALRRITELSQDLIRHTSAPLQTRNIILKIHDVASSFREMVGVPVGPAGAGQLALNANCLANVLATLLRSLRVFSP